MEDAVDLSQFVFDEQYKRLVESQSDLLWLSKEFLRLKAEKEGLEERLTEINKAFDFVRISVIPSKMDDAGVGNITFPGLGRLQTAGDAHVRILPGMKEQAYQWLSDVGLGDLIQPYVQPSTLKSAIIKIYTSGEIDEQFETMFEVAPFKRASVVKVTKSGQ